MKQQYSKLPSGKVIHKVINDRGELIKEGHSYGMLEIGITIEYYAGKASEMYFLSKKPASRKRYEQACTHYSDMPLPNIEADDFFAKLRKDLRVERSQRKIAADADDNPVTAKAIDDFCVQVLNKGKRADANEWIESLNNTLGEFSHTKSRNLVARLVKAGVKSVYACEIDTSEDGKENTGHLVVELTEDPAARKSILREVRRLALLQGYDGPAEMGQQYSYIGLD